MEIDFDAGGLIFGENEIMQELQMIGDFVEGALDGWNQHLLQLRIKYPALRYSVSK